DAAAEDGPAAQFAAIGDAYLDWALSNPTHFQIISSREIMDFATPSPIRARNDAIRAEMIVLLEQMQTRGELHAQADLDQLVLAARAHVYGLARMAVDGHLPEWYDREPPRAAMRNALRLFLASILPAPAP
ncbi:WHG domain-containing protein, partial [Escherichia coli]|nr:WHG domain-containing protein [Escherichia coli]